MQSVNKKLLNSRELAEVLKVSHVTIYGWARKGMPNKKRKRGHSETMVFELQNVLSWCYSNIDNFKYDKKVCMFCGDSETIPLIDISVYDNLNGIIAKVFNASKQICITTRNRDKNNPTGDYHKSTFNIPIKHCPMCGKKLSRKRSDFFGLSNS
jgi:hypothetical protein